MLPDGWKETTLNDLIHIKHGYAFQSDYFASDGDYAVVTPGNFHESGGFREQREKRKYYTGAFSQEYVLRIGSCIIAMTEQGPGLLGSVAFIKQDNFYLHNQRIGLIDILNPERICIQFVYWIYNNPYTRRVIANESGGTKVKHTSPKSLVNITVLLPPLPEQKKIAAILSTWDRAIEVTEKLLANSQQQKKALMQQLLTGKKRLPGFTGEWKAEKFSELFTLKIGGTPSRSRPDYWDTHKETANRWVAISDLKTDKIYETREYITDLGIKNSNCSLIPAGSIIISFKLTIGKKAILGRPCFTNEAICALSIKKPDEVDCFFVFHMLDVVDYDSEIDQAVKGKTLNKDKIARLTMLVAPLREQKAIASVLTKADEEIALLKADLTRLRQEKKALMQQLLTGKRRVKTEADAG